MQDYSEIELLISNDNSDDFNESELILYLNKFRQPNIKKVYINKNERNLGTVKHANRILRKASGEIIFYLAADDALHDKYVISKFVDKFNESSENLLLITSQCGMYDEHLDLFLEPALSVEKISKIINYSPLEMFVELSHTYTIPAAGTIYRRKFFDVVGFYDEDYVLIEDSPIYAKMCRMGIKPLYLDFESVKHRHGGISHGNQHNPTATSKNYLHDEILFIKKEYLPYMNLLSITEQRAIKDRLLLMQDRYFWKYEYPNLSWQRKFKIVVPRLPIIIRIIIKKIIIRFPLTVRNILILYISSLITLLWATSIGISGKQFLSPQIDLVLNRLFTIIGQFLLVLCIFLFLVKIVIKCISIIKNLSPHK